jgi:hypothetical protein
VPSRADLEQQAALNAAIVEMAWEQLQDGWASLGLTSKEITTQAALDVVTDLMWDILTAWGDVAATSAADFFDQLRAQSGASGTFTALLADMVKRDQVAGTVRWALDPWAQAITPPTRFDPVTGDALPVERTLPDEFDLDRMLAKLKGPTQRLILQTARSTIDQSAARDPARPRVARVPMGEETCAFCLVLASRGPVYRSLGSAGHDNRFHDDDDCEQVLVWTAADELPEGYDPGALHEKYLDARRAAGSSDLRKILRELRLQEGIH